ncbi:MAG TPA: DUF523 domain-containing protein [Candidatus Latescibacteria bacterium]|nr:DUF523 domain-containing protein [Candidatus Latescibacterota bacterium]
MGIEFIVSACLAGLNCRHDGANCELSDIKTLVSEGRALPICPEQLGGLPTPRSICEIVGGDGRDVLEGIAKVFSQDGMDMTELFIKGAQQTLYLAQLIGARGALLKQKSPSCGCGQIFRRKLLVAGYGVTAALLKKNGIQVEPMG